MIIDTHCHLNNEQYEQDYEEIIKNASENNIKAMIVVGSDLDTSKKALKLANKYKNVYAIIGSHPCDCETYNEENEKFYLENAINEKVVAIGEIGLDYFYLTGTKEKQKEIFVKQLEIANKVNLPVCFHLRDAYDDFLNIIEENKHLINNGGVIHCYSGSLEFAKQMIKYGFKLGLDGPLTFKNNRKSVEVVEKLDLKHFVVETDCPYLSPEPFRGKRNEPKYINYVAQKIARIKNMEIDEVEKILLNNTYDLYKKLKP